jgi:preprotein translocase subunit SecY
MKKIPKFFNDRPVMKRILITLGFITLFRLGVSITMPGATLVPGEGFETGTFLGILDMLGGGGLSTFSILALGVTPYITAGIIIQLLSSDVVPYLSNLKKKGERGRIKQEKITRIVAVLFAILQGMAIVLSMENAGFIEFTGLYGSY